MSLIGLAAIVTAASAVYGASESAKTGRKTERESRRQRQANSAWYNRRVSENPMQTSENAYALGKMRDMMKERNNAAAGRAAVAGASNESVAATKQVTNNAVADATAQMAAKATARRDAIDQEYRQQDAKLSQQQMALDQQKSANIAKAAGQTASSLGQVAATLATPNSVEQLSNDYYKNTNTNNQK